LISAINESTDLNTKGIIMTAWLDLSLNGYQDVIPESVNRSITELGADHPIWGLNAYSVFAAMDLLSDTAFKINFLYDMSAMHENARVKEAATYYGFVVADEALNTEKRQFFYDKLLTEFPQSQFVEYAKYQFDPNNKVQSGTVAPAFSVASLDGKSTYSNAQFSGKFVLLDFWATWCGPCIQEMDELHSVYDEFKSNKFELLSLSFDQSKDEVVSFRKERYPMPWLHTFVDGGFENELAQRYEVTGIPKPILINPEGKIVAMGIQLRGANLRKTLARFLN
jgi:thiol-disulfide isomerase/thioredoxin